MKINIQRKFTSRSDRVKALDFHPTEPWVLVSLYNGSAHIWNYDTTNLVKSFEVCEHPIRAGRFIARKSWIVLGSDDMTIRVFNYNTHEKVSTFEAHSDYIRSIALHPTQPFILTSSDDLTIKLWDWERGWKSTKTYEGHSHYVMMVLFNPRDANTFASASLDRTIKVWSLGATKPNFTLEGHEKGVNCIDYYPAGDKPYIVSGADDKLVKIWDYQNKSCVQTLEGHFHNVTTVMFHLELPVIVSGSEDGSVRLWNSNTYRLETSLNYGLERVWCLAGSRVSNDVAVGCDEGTVVVKIGREEPAISMDSSGKLIWSRHNDVLTANVNLAETDVRDGQRLPLTVKEFGSCELYPAKLLHSPNGRFVTVIGDGEYIIYTALAWRNKGYGSAMDFAWSPSNEYAIVDAQNRVRMFDRQFKERTDFLFQPVVNFPVSTIQSGALLCVKAVSNFIVFYDWETGIIVRKVDVDAHQIYWNDSGTMVAIATEATFFLLKYDKEAFANALESGKPFTEEGLESAFEFYREIEEGVKTGCWVGECFLYTNSSNRLNYAVGGQITTLAHFDAPRYLLGYLPKTNLVYVCDKEAHVFPYYLNLKVLEFETAVIRGAMDVADQILKSIPRESADIEQIARFLENQGFREMALSVTTKDEHKFDLALQLGRLSIALDVAKTVDQPQKWRAVADTALQQWEFTIAEDAMWKGQDLEGLLMLYSCSGDLKGLQSLLAAAEREKKTNVSFPCAFLLKDLEKCVKILSDTGRAPEAALFARTYMPSAIPHAVGLWKEKLGGQQTSHKTRLADRLAAQEELWNQIPDFEYALMVEKSIRHYQQKHPAQSGKKYQDVSGQFERDVLAEFKRRFPNGVPSDLELSKVYAEVTGDGEGAGSGGESAGLDRFPAPISGARGGINGLASEQDSLPSTATFRREADATGSTIPTTTAAVTTAAMDALSMEVNTTGTGSVRGMDDFDNDCLSEATSFSNAAVDDEVARIIDR